MNFDKLIEHGKYKEAFECVVAELETEGAGDDSELRDLFVFALETYCDRLNEEQNDIEVLHAYETALKFFGRDTTVLYELGSVFEK